MMIVALLIAAAAPSAEAERLGRQLAETGTLAAVLPVIREKETAELLAANADLPEADRAKLKAAADRVFDAGRERLLSATGHAFAERLSLEDLRRLVEFHQSETAERYRAASPEVIAATMKAVGPMDFKKDVLAAFCKETGKLCEPK